MSEFNFTNKQLKSAIEISKKIYDFGNSMVKILGFKSMLPDENPIFVNKFNYYSFLQNGSLLFRIFSLAGNLSDSNEYLNFNHESNLPTKSPLLKKYVHSIYEANYVCELSDHHCDKLIKHIKRQFNHNKDLKKLYMREFNISYNPDYITYHFLMFVMRNPVQYRLLTMKDYPIVLNNMYTNIFNYFTKYLKKNHNLSLFEAYYVIHTNYSAYYIGKQTGITQAEIGKLRNGKIGWNKVTLRTIGKLVKFFKTHHLALRIEHADKYLRINPVHLHKIHIPL